MDIKAYKLNQLYFYLVNGCNLACRHCWIDPGFNSDPNLPGVSLDISLFKDIIRQAKPLGLGAVKLTGGEPLIHPRIRDILTHVREEGLGLTIETNGVGVTDEIARGIAACKGAFASVSVDGASADSHEWVRGVKGSFDAAWRGVKMLADNGLRPQIIMSLMRRNSREIEPLVRMAEMNGAGSVKFNIVQPTARGKAMHGDDQTLGIEELIETGRWVENELSRTTSLRLIYSHPPAFRPLSKLFGDSKDKCGICGIFGILGVLADGSYALCGIGQTVPELVFGNAAKDKLKDVWEKSPVLNTIRQDLPSKLEGVCAECIMKNRCFGSCVAMNYSATKNLFSGFWFCEQAKASGLFPETRVKRIYQKAVI